MTKNFLYFTIALLFAGMSLWGCSNNSGEESEKGAIRQMTDQVAKDLVHKMRDPIDKARAVKVQQEEGFGEVKGTAE